MRLTRLAKAAKLLTGGRVLVTHVGPWEVAALVAGDHGDYQVGYSNGRWSCTCPGGVFGSCSHRAAVELVADPARSFRARSGVTFS